MNPAKLSLKRRLALEIVRQQRKDADKRHELRTLFWESTHRCNVNCLHCGSDCTASTTNPDMPAEDFLRVLDTITPHVDQHKVLIIISGGEPLMRQDLEQVGAEVARRGYPWGMVTNGLALNASKLDSLIKSGLRSITVSLDGMPEEHNWLRGHKLSFDRALEAVRAISQRPELAWDIVTCVNSRSIDHLEEFKELLIENGVKSWRLFTIFPMGRAANQPELFLSPAQYRSLMDFIITTRKEGRIHASYCCEGFLGEYEGEVRDHFYKCTAGISTASVLIDGSISACGSIRADYVQGNIYNDDFMDVWNNRFEKYRNREWMRTGKCGDCKMWRYCQGNGMHLRESDGSLLRCNLEELCKE